MKTLEDVFCDFFYAWWRDQTIPQKMTWERAKKITADCSDILRRKLVPGQMTQDAFNEHMGTAQKVILFSVSWDEAKKKSIDDFQKERQMP
jgi:hypothetical protein